MQAVQAGLFLVALVLLLVDPNAERSYYVGSGDPRSCDVNSVVETPDTQAEQHDVLQTIFPDLAVVGTMPVVEMRCFIMQPLSAISQDRGFHPYFVTSIWCSSDL